MYCMHYWSYKLIYYSREVGEIDAVYNVIRNLFGTHKVKVVAEECIQMSAQQVESSQSQVNSKFNSTCEHT